MEATNHNLIPRIKETVNFEAYPWRTRIDSVSVWMVRGALSVWMVHNVRRCPSSEDNEDTEK